MENKVIENESEKTASDDTNKFEEVKVYQEVEPVKKEERTDSYFDGGLLELIGWRLLSFLITGITLGLGAPWGKCMLYSYQIKHTVYNGKRLKFEGTGGDLFVNMFKWVLLTIITFGIYGFFVPVRKTKWVISNIHFEDEEFNKNESFFDGKTIQLIGINILCRVLNTISLNLLYPFTVCFQLKWINKHTVINRKKVAFNGRAISLFGKYILWTFLTIITFGIYGWWLHIKMLKWQTKNIHIKVVGEEEKKDKSLLIAIPIAIIGIILLISILPVAIDKISNIDPESEFSDIIDDFDLEDAFKDLKPIVEKASGSESEFGGLTVLPVEIEPSKVIPSEAGQSEVVPSEVEHEVEAPVNNEPERWGAPTASEIAGTYNARIIEEYLVDGIVDESRTQETWETIEIKYENGRLRYNNSFSMDYDSSLGYASYYDETLGYTTAEAYFSYEGNSIRIGMRIYSDDFTKDIMIDGTK